MEQDELDALLSEQVAYYRARAAEYDASAPWELEADSHARLVQALRDFGPRGRVLELACGTGVWTAELAAQCDDLTALDASPEMIELARERLLGRDVRFITADIFGWRPDQRYDTIFFSAWLSHVPPQRFERFWKLVDACLADSGRVFVIDELPAGAAEEEIVADAVAPAVRRPLSSGQRYRAVKVFYEPEALRARLAALGWRFETHEVGWRFFYAAGARAPASSSLAKRTRDLIESLRDADDAAAAELVANLSRSQRALAPLALAVGGVQMLFGGLKVLVSNWRLLLVQLLPVALTWLAMYDLKAHALHTRAARDLGEPLLIVIALAIVVATAAAFFMNSVFAFAVSQPGRPEVRPAIERARTHLGLILGSGAVVGVMLAVAGTVVSRAHRPWFVVSLGVATGVMMLCFVAIPARLIGVKPEAPRRDKLSATIVAGAVGLVVAAPPYVLGRVGVLMLGVRLLFIPGLVVVTVAVTLEAGATVAVKSVKMTSKLVSGAGGRVADS